MFRRLLRPLAGQIDVAAQFERAGGGLVARRSGCEIVGGGIQLTAAEPGFAALQVPQHGVRLEADRLVEVRDGAKRIPAGEGELALEHGAAIQALAAGHRVAVEERGDDQRQHGNGEYPLHRGLTVDSTIAPYAGLVGPQHYLVARRGPPPSLRRGAPQPSNADRTRVAIPPPGESWDEWELSRSYGF